MLKSIFIILFTGFVFCLHAQDEDKDLEIAKRYFADGEYEKATPLFLSSYEKSKALSTLELYTNSLIGDEKYDEARASLKKLSKKNKDKIYYFYYLRGCINKADDKIDDAEQDFKEAWENLPDTPETYHFLGEELIDIKEYKTASFVLEAGKEMYPEYDFSEPLGIAYMQLKQYNKVIEQYLSYLDKGDRYLNIAQQYFNFAYRFDDDGSLKESTRVALMKRIQTRGSTTAYTRMLIWVYQQQKNYAGALKQAIALSKRTNAHQHTILELAQNSERIKDYATAMEGYDYLMSLGNRHPYYSVALEAKGNMSYNMFIDEGIYTEEAYMECRKRMEASLEAVRFLGKTPTLLKNYSHLLAFYGKDVKSAVARLDTGIKFAGYNVAQKSELQLELADVYLYEDKMWDALLLYSKIIEGNKENEIGDLTKLKKAKLSYFMGNFEYAKGQLDVIKASTSKLTSNDGFVLSLLIGNNLEEGIDNKPLQLFSKADLYMFRNQLDSANSVIDTILSKYGFSTLADDALMRKADICNTLKEYARSADILQRIINNYPNSESIDKVIFRLAELYDFKLNDKAKAKELYKTIILEYSNSIHAVVARMRYNSSEKPDES
ncbi:MAG: tetratricopeptide repeat protein [Bacteroidales bacterium]